MKTKLRFVKSLLVMAALCLGSSSAWATTYSGNVSFSAQNRITNNGDGTFTTASNAGNQYALALADLSALENIASATSVTLEFDVTVGGRLVIGIGDKNTRGTTANGSSKATYNTVGLIMRYGTTDGSTVRVNGGTNNASALNVSSRVSFTLNRTTGKYSYTITDAVTGETTYFSASNVENTVSNATVVEAYSWNNNQTIAISDVSYSYEYTPSSFDYTVKAIDSGDNELATIASGTSTEAVTVSYPRAINIGGVWYTCPATNNFSVEATSLNPNPTITYTADNTVVYFREAEDITGSQNVSSALCSGGTYVNYYAGPTSVDITEAGTYELETNVVSRNTNSSLEVYTNNSTTSVALIAKNGSLGTRTCSFVAADGSTMKVGGPYYDNNFQNSLGFDYILIRKTSSASTIAKTISAAGWATYCSPYALDLANATGLTDAYIVTGGAAGVLTKTSVVGGTVPANTGLLLKGAEGTVTIPVVASSSTDVSANKLKGVTSNTEIAANAGYVLMGTPSLGFYQNSNAFTVGANTAYLPAGFDGAGARTFFQLDAETTGINAIENAETVNGIYNLAGQRVAQPTRGLYIVNGKKIVVK